MSVLHSYQMRMLAIVLVRPRGHASKLVSRGARRASPANQLRSSLGILKLKSALPFTTFVRRKTKIVKATDEERRASLRACLSSPSPSWGSLTGAGDDEQTQLHTALPRTGADAQAGVL